MSINMINECRPFEVNSNIVEWDMKRAGIHIIKELNLLPESDIKYYESLPKKESDIAIGKRQIEDREFSKSLENGFTDIMNEFLDANHIDRDIDVISIKKDACFVINKKIKKYHFGKWIEFVPKNKYHAYISVKPFLKRGNAYEFYFQRNGDIDIKGLTSDKTTRKYLISLHKEGILNFLLCVVDIAEKTGVKPKEMNLFLHEFVEMYKRKQLDYDYYREFNVTSKFRYQFLGSEVLMDKIDENILDKIRIDYNYIHIIIPVVNLIV